MKRQPAAGFTLIEMVIALALSMVVLVAIISVSTNMINLQFQDIKSGSVTNLTWLSLDQMNREVENATHLELPGPNVSDTGDVLSGCVNWSNRANPNGAAIDPSQPYYSFYYCVDPSGNLYRYEKDGLNSCPFPAPGAHQGVAATGACGDASFASAATTTNILVYSNDAAHPTFSHDPNYSYYFKKSSPVSGVEFHYIVGKNPAPPGDPNAKHYIISTMIGMNKSYNNGND